MDIRRRLREDRGETLLELLIAITILGVCVMAFGSSIALGVATSDQHRKQADAGALVRSYAEQIDSYVAAGNYTGCAAANWYSPLKIGVALPPGYRATQSAGLTIGVALLLFRRIRVRNRPHQDFAQARGNRSHLRPANTFGEIDGGKSLVDQLASEINVRAVLERHNNPREAEFGDGPHGFQTGQPADRLLDRKGDALFDFFGRQGRRHGVDLDLNGCGIGECINVEVAQRHCADSRER